MKIHLSILALAAALVLPASAAEAANARTTGDVNMRAGPSTEYPRIAVLQRGLPVTIHGCLRGRSWCDVSAYGDRGWVSSHYLDAFYDRRRVYVPSRPVFVPPTVSFDFGYWDRHYAHRPFYRDRRWRDYRRDRDWRHRDRDWDHDRDREHDGRADWRDRDRDQADWRDRDRNRDRDRDRAEWSGDHDRGKGNDPWWRRRHGNHGG